MTPAHPSFLCFIAYTFALHPFPGLLTVDSLSNVRHTVSVAYAARIADTPIAGDDASDVVSLTTRQLAEMPDEEFAFDHELIIRDYL
eukprot:11366523-Prorocentrum_lima.AAC.1